MTTTLKGHPVRTVVYPNTPQGWSALNWAQLCATPTTGWGNRNEIHEVQLYLTELRRQITAASTDHVLATELALSCPLQNTSGELVFHLEADTHSRIALAAALRDAGPLTAAMREQTRALRQQTKTMRRKDRGEEWHTKS